MDGLSIQYPKGRLVKSAQGSTRNVSSFDVGGRVLTNWQCTPLNCGTGWFTLTYAYNLIGGMTSYTDGVGHTFTQSFDTAGRVTQLTSSLTGPQYPATLASNFSYNAAGAVEYMKFGNNLYHRVDMNNRLQPCRFRVTTAATAAVPCSATDPTGDTLQMKYSYNHGTANNGNVMAWSATGAQSFSRGYTYDALNRLQTMASTGATCTALEWTYDIWGNRTNQNLGPGGAACGTHHPTINTKNQIADTGYVYDAAGNMTAEPGKTYQYDAEGRLVSLNNGCPSTLCYTYDANGRRVRKIASGVTTEYIYHQSGIVVAEKVGSTWTVGYVYLNGQLLAQYKNGTTYFAHKDHLGSTRLLTKPDGSYDSADVYDYLPYGEPAGSTSTTTSHKFTGHERDAESGLDYFEARYYSSPYGRFQSADYFMNDTTVRDPQKWNLYTYVRNSPIRFIDPTGEKIYVGDLSDSDRDEVLRRLNATYGCDSCVSMDEGGYLQVNTEELKEEVRKAAAFLTDAINSEMKFFEVNVSNNDPNVAFGNSQAGGSVVWQGRRTSAIKITLDFGDDKAIAGDSEARSTFLDLVLAHEVRHYFPSGADDPSRCCSTGPVVDATNEITNALGRPRRAQYIAGRRPEPFVDVPFKKNTVDGQGRPKEQTVYLYWNKNSVGGKGIN